jgi:hypothetical protein
MSSSAPATAIAYRLSTWIAGLMVLAAGPGLLRPSVYRDNLLVASGWRGTDLVTLGLALPVLVGSRHLAKRGSARAGLVWLGALLYTVYAYGFYLFGAAYNALFLAYAALFTLSLLALGFGAWGLEAGTPVLRLDPGTPVRGGAAWLALLALGLGSAHVAMALGYLFTGRLPQVVTATGHPTNVVAALDLALVVAPSLLAALWLWRGELRGVVLGVLVNMEGALYMTALTAATAAAWRAGAPVEARQGFLWAGIGFGCLLSAAALLGGLRAGR